MKGGFVIDSDYKSYLWKETKDSDYMFVKKNNGDILYEGEVPERIIVVGIPNSEFSKLIYKRRKIDNNKLSHVCEYFRLLELESEYPTVEEQEENGFQFWSSCEDPCYRSCSASKVDAIKERYIYKVIELYCE